jgi:hypothetical protein
MRDRVTGYAILIRGARLMRLAHCESHSAARFAK